MNRTVSFLVISLLAMNTLDGVLTLYAVLTGKATEWNPLMGALLAVSALAFAVIKLGVVNLIIGVLGGYARDLAWVRRPLSIVAGCYWLVMLFHLGAFL